MDLLETIQAALEGHASPEAGTVLVGVSGGADSVALLLAMKQLGYDVEALHANFELRGLESDRDETFVRKVCREHHIGITVKHFRTKAEAQRQGISIEMAARQLRYEWFARMARLRKAQCVCVAHHRDDQAETLLLNLLRGTGLRGLCGMKRAGTISTTPGGPNGTALAGPTAAHTAPATAASRQPAIATSRAPATAAVPLSAASSAPATATSNAPATAAVPLSAASSAPATATSSAPAIAAVPPNAASSAPASAACSAPATAAVPPSAASSVPATATSRQPACGASSVPGGFAARVSSVACTVPLLRPLLDVSRADIEAWLSEQGQTWATDSTNLQPDAALRNKIRLEVMPLLRQLNPAVSRTLCQTAERLADATLLYDYALASQRRLAETAVGIDIEALRRTIAPRTVLFEILKDRGFTAEQAADIYEHLDGEPGHEWQSAEWRLLRDRGQLLWRRCDDRFAMAPAVLPLEGLAEPAKGVRLLIRRQAVYPGFEIPRKPDTACFDLEKLTLPLTVRQAREADRLQPFGMDGTRLVSDLLTDLKLSVFEKERQLVVESGDRICWVVGRRAAAGFEVDEHTRFAMTLTAL